RSGIQKIDRLHPTSQNNDYIQFVDILNRCLVYDHQERMSTHEIIDALNKINK
ncbi:hypothetical protein EBI_26932, partial [Enterocytozoon bieneusi H348]